MLKKMRRNYKMKNPRKISKGMKSVMKSVKVMKGAKAPRNPDKSKSMK